MRPKSRQLQRDQFALLVAVERMAAMLRAQLETKPGPVLVRVEHGNVAGWDDVLEVARGSDERESETRWQVKRQTTELEGEVIVKLLEELRDHHSFGGCLILRDLVAVRDMGELRVLRDLSDRAKAGDPETLISTGTADELAWITKLATELGLGQHEVLVLLGRFAVKTANESDLRRLAEGDLQVICPSDPAGAFEAIHSYLALNPDGAIGYTARFLRETVLKDKPLVMPKSDHVRRMAELAADLFAERDQFLRFKEQVDDELGVPIPDGKLASNNTYKAALDWLAHLNKRGALASVKPHFAREVRSHSRRLLAKEERLRKRWEDLDRDVEHVAVPALAAEAPPLTDSASKEPEP